MMSYYISPLDSGGMKDTELFSAYMILGGDHPPTARVMVLHDLSRLATMAATFLEHGSPELSYGADKHIIKRAALLRMF